MTTRRCAWCQTILEQGDDAELSTHTVCPSCTEELDAEIAKDMAKREAESIVSDLCAKHGVTGKY